AYIWTAPKRGDIVVVRPRVNVGSVVKRIVGMPGERLQILDGIVTVREDRNSTSTPLDEVYLNGLTTKEIGTTYIQLDPFEYFVFGDDREVSIDSRELGPVDIYNIKGKPFLIFNTKNFSFRLI
ncbi:MAG: signal peptidase I, partial [Minisyncoccia bacterium]